MKYVSLSEVAEINPRAPKSLKNAPNTKVSFVPMAAVSEKGFLNAVEERTAREVLKGYTYFERGDVLIAKITPCMENGKAVHLNSLPLEVGFGSTEFHVLRPGSEIDGRYLFHMVWNKSFRYAAEQNMTGTAGQKRVPTDFFDRIQIPLPPLPEQKRIAAILDKADAIRKKRKKAIELTETFLRSTFLEMFGDPVTNPKGWKKAAFGRLAENLDGQRVPIKAAERMKMKGIYPYYGASGVIDYVNDYIFHETTLLIAEDGANLLARVTPIAFLATGKYWVNNHAHVVRYNGEAELGYLKDALNIIDISNYVTGSAQPKLNQQNLNRIEIPNPPLEMQKKYIQIVEKTNDKLLRISKWTESYKHLFKSLVQRAFMGDL